MWRNIPATRRSRPLEMCRRSARVCPKVQSPEVDDVCQDFLTDPRPTLRLSSLHCGNGVYKRMGENNNRAPDRRARGRTQSNDALVAHLEQLSGRRIKSRQDISDYVSDLSAKAAARRSKAQHLQNLSRVAFLVAAAGQYYVIDIQLEILAQPTLTVFVPVKGDSAPRRPYI